MFVKLLRSKLQDVRSDNLVAMNDSGARESYETGAIREPSKGKGAFELITPFAEDRLALWYEAGAEKYELRNWEKGIKFSRLMQSTMRHINKWETICLS